MCGTVAAGLKKSVAENNIFHGYGLDRKRNRENIVSQVFVRENRPYCETHLELLSLQRKTPKSRDIICHYRKIRGVADHFPFLDRLPVPGLKHLEDSRNPAVLQI
ncbi:putative FAD-linked oxidoreductase YgcU [Frankliniella fusca]|uniref:FAD-linked oxidoreductase YgcU n=1 Tax=Frankliniella fusca TaxID=407009 RepID=A0AAE1I1T7_9NEOP|nr:putative FAD-linked oxidoreductase YgcU [Frankliniella fusca]